MCISIHVYYIWTYYVYSVFLRSQWGGSLNGTTELLESLNLDLDPESLRDDSVRPKPHDSSAARSEWATACELLDEALAEFSEAELPDVLLNCCESVKT